MKKAGASGLHGTFALIELPFRGGVSRLVRHETNRPFLHVDRSPARQAVSAASRAGTKRELVEDDHFLCV